MPCSFSVVAIRFSSFKQLASFFIKYEKLDVLEIEEILKLMDKELGKRT